MHERANVPEVLACAAEYAIMPLLSAGVVQLVEHLLAKEKVTSSSLVARSIIESLTKRPDYVSSWFLFCQVL